MTENPAALCLKGQERRGVFVSVMAAVMAVGALALMAAALVRRAALQLLQNLPQLAHGHIIYLLGVYPAPLFPCRFWAQPPVVPAVHRLFRQWSQTPSPSAST